MDRNVEDADRVVKKIVSSGGKAISFKADVTKKAELQAKVEETKKKFGGIDILVNNAGTESPAALAVDITEANWDRVLNVNLKGPFLCCQAVIPTMMQQKKGKIVNIGSIASIRMTFFGAADYSASKHGLAGLSQHLAWELADSHINVNTVCPGGVVSEGLKEVSTPEFRAGLEQRLVPLGRFCTPDEIAQAVIFFASERSDIITGQLLPVDGGVLVGYGEDLRAKIRERMQTTKEKKSAHVA
jgi:NAD(P)-dependent dehydrogenase (short-subunit alcohol dehydrogenase family)